MTKLRESLILLSRSQEKKLIIITRKEEELKQKAPVLKTDKGATQQTKEKK